MRPACRAANFITVEICPSLKARPFSQVGETPGIYNLRTFSEAFFLSPASQNVFALASILSSHVRDETLIEPAAYDRLTILFLHSLFLFGLSGSIPAGA